MWPFKKRVEPPTAPSTRKPHYETIDYQSGDSVVCICDDAHSETHQKLLNKGDIYHAREIQVWVRPDNGFGGPFVKLVGIFPSNDRVWRGSRFKKVQKLTKKTEITEQVMLPAGLDEKKERELARELYK